MRYRFGTIDFHRILWALFPVNCILFMIAYLPRIKGQEPLYDLLWIAGGMFVTLLPFALRGYRIIEIDPSQQSLTIRRPFAWGTEKVSLGRQFRFKILDRSSGKMDYIFPSIRERSLVFENSSGTWIELVRYARFRSSAASKRLLEIEDFFRLHQQTKTISEAGPGYLDENQEFEREPNELSDWKPRGLQKGIAYLGFPVELREDDFVSSSRITFTLTGLTVLFSLIAFTSLQEACWLFGFRPIEPISWTWFTSMFVHANPIHLIGNLYFLVIFGDNVEEILGPRKFISLIILGQLGSCVLEWMVYPNRYIPAIGASGYISSIMVYYLLNWRTSRFGIFLGGYTFKISGWWLFLLSMSMDLAGWIASPLTRSNVSFAGHIGGAIIGGLFWWHVRPTKTRSHDIAGSESVRV